MSNFLIVLIVDLGLICIIKCNKNNVCPTFQDYYKKEINPRCGYDPDVFSAAIDLLDRYNYTYEVYTTVTPDDYILNVYRLPPKRNKSKGLVFLAHPALCNMIVWLDKGRQSMAFQLVEEGYDVWMGNFRGTLYSQEHVTLSRSDQPNEYFNYSFHEMGIYDIPIQLELVRNKSGSSSKIYYVGHSMGTTAAFIYASMLPKHAEEYIHLFILWAPTAFINVKKSILGLLIPFMEKVISSLHLENRFAYNTLTLVIYYICYESPRLSETCGILLEVAFGFDEENISPFLFPSLLIHNGYGLSFKAVMHYAQLYTSGRFQWYDYGKSNNYYYYNSPIPPEYPLENISTPMHFFYGSRDTVAPISETLHLYSILRPEFRYGITQLSYSHATSLYGKNLYEKLYLPTIRIIENFLDKK